MKSSNRIGDLKSIDWARIGTNKNRDDLNNACEFLRRAAIFLRNRNISGQPPFFNIARILGIVASDELKRQVNEIVTSNEFVIAKRIGLYYVQTAEIEEACEIYGPLIDVFQHGGCLDYHHGELIVDDEWAVPLTNWIEKFGSVVA